jgi:O-acetyl-ADP-ribose deacetylase (regulator of RNase III)
MLKEVDGDLIQLALRSEFDIITHGCNCFCKMKSGIAPLMHKSFYCNNSDIFTLEGSAFVGDINKLGQIEYVKMFVHKDRAWPYWWEHSLRDEIDQGLAKEVHIINSYTQYSYDRNSRPLNYHALRLCFMKINHIFKGKHLGIPKIGAGLAGGNWNKISSIIQEVATDIDITVVNYKSNQNE